MARSFTATGNDRVEVVTGATLFGETTASILAYFKCPSSGANKFIYSENVVWNEQIFVYVTSGGAVLFWWRTPTAIAMITSSTGFDDDNWHRVLAVRNASGSFELFVDGVSEGTDTANDPGTLSSTPTIYLGNLAGGPDEGMNGELARIATFKTNLTIGQAETFLIRPSRLGIAPELWAELIGTTVEPDWSPNKYSLTLNGSPPKADHAPVAPAFGFNSALLYAVAGGAKFQTVGSCTVTAGGVLATGITVAANVACSTVAAAALTTSIILGSAINASASAASNLTTSINLDAAVALSATQASSLTTQIEMVSAVSAQATVAGELAVGLNLDAAVTGITAVAGDLSTQISLAASIAASSVTASQLTTGISLVANVGGQTASTGELATDITLSASAKAAVSVLGILNAQQIFNVVQLSADFQVDAAKSALFGVTRNNGILFTRNRMKEVWF